MTAPGCGFNRYKQHIGQIVLLDNIEIYLQDCHIKPQLAN
jgi:hypothetical protein